jgi:hypothetical protein
MKNHVLLKATFLFFVLTALTSCSFSYAMYRDCDGRTQKVKTIHPKCEWRLGY